MAVVAHGGAGTIDSGPSKITFRYDPIDALPVTGQDWWRKEGAVGAR
jgi:hypothetical protein